MAEKKDDPLFHPPNCHSHFLTEGLIGKRKVINTRYIYISLAKYSYGCVLDSTYYTAYKKLETILSPGTNKHKVFPSVPSLPY